MVSTRSRKRAAEPSLASSEGGEGKKRRGGGASAAAKTGVRVRALLHELRHCYLPICALVPLLRELCQLARSDEDSRAILARHGEICVVLAALRANAGEAAVQAAGLGLLAELIKEDTTGCYTASAILVPEGAVGMALATLRAHAGEAAVQAAGLNLLAELDEGWSAAASEDPAAYSPTSPAYSPTSSLQFAVGMHVCLDGSADPESTAVVSAILEESRECLCAVGSSFDPVAGARTGGLFETQPMRRLARVPPQEADHIVMLRNCEDAGIERGQFGVLVSIDETDAIIKVGGSDDMKIVDYAALGRCDPATATASSSSSSSSSSSGGGGSSGECAVGAALAALRAHASDATVQGAGLHLLEVADGEAALLARSEDVMKLTLAALCAHAGDATVESRTVESRGLCVLGDLASHNEGRAAVLESGCALGTVLAVLRANIGNAVDSELQEGGLNLMGNLALSEEGRAAILASDGAIGVALAVLRAHAGEMCYVQTAGMEMMKNLVLGDEGRATVLASDGAIGLVVAALRAPADDADDARIMRDESALGVLSALAIHDGGRAAILASDGVIDAALVALRKHAGASASFECDGESAVQEEGLGLLVNLALSDEGRAAVLASDGAIGVVLAVLRVRAGVPAIQAPHTYSAAKLLYAFSAAKVLEMSLGLLGHLVLSDGGRDAVLASDGAIVAVLATLRPFAPEVREKGLGLLRRLVLSDEGVPAILASDDAIGAVLVTLRAHAGEADIQVAALNALHNLTVLSSGETGLSWAAFLASDDAIGAVVAALRAQEGEAAVQVAGLNLMNNLTLIGHDEGNAAIVASEGAIGAVLAALRAHGGESAVTEKGFQLLFNLALSDEGRDAILASDGAVGEVLAVLRANTGDTGIDGDPTGASGLKVLLMLAHASEGRDAILASDDAIGVVLAVLRAYAGWASVQENGLSLLYLFSFRHEAAILASDSAIGVAVAALQAHAGESRVQERGISLLVNLVSGVGGRAAILAADGAIGAVVAALRAHVGKAEVQVKGFVLLAYLAASDEGRAAILASNSAKVLDPAPQPLLSSGAVPQMAGDQAAAAAPVQQQAVRGIIGLALAALDAGEPVYPSSGESLEVQKSGLGLLCSLFDSDEGTVLRSIGAWQRCRRSAVQSAQRWQRWRLARSRGQRWRRKG